MIVAHILFGKYEALFGTYKSNQNAIALYVLAESTSRIIIMIRGTMQNIRLKAWIYDNLFVSWLGDLNGSLGFAIVYVLFWLGILTIFYKKRIFIKI